MKYINLTNYKIRAEDDNIENEIENALEEEIANDVDNEMKTTPREESSQ